MSLKQESAVKMDKPRKHINDTIQLSRKYAAITSQKPPYLDP
jgi:hypothetical protein